MDDIGIGSVRFKRGDVQIDGVKAKVAIITGSDGAAVVSVRDISGFPDVTSLYVHPSNTLYADMGQIAEFEESGVVLDMRFSREVGDNAKGLAFFICQRGLKKADALSLKAK